MQTSDYPWLDDFIGRELDLAALLREFNAVCDSDQPRFVALVAEPGVGKTRLVQQVYHSLRSSNDPSGYWPASFPGDHVSLRLDPDFKMHYPIQSAGPPSIPYLWWAVRFPPQSQRNDPVITSCGLLASAYSLLPHLEHARAARLLSEERKQALDLFVDVVIEYAPVLLEQALPGLGLGKAALQKYRKNKRLRDEKARIQAAIASKGAFHEQQIVDIEARLLDGLAFLVQSGPTTKPARKLPVILVLDDLHGIDARSVALLKRILAQATEHHWPLLVLTTVWPQPWCDAAASTDSPLAELRDILRQVGLPVTKRPLVRLLHPTAIVDRALPGLTRSQRDLLIERMGGDLYALHLWLSDLRKRDRLFVDHDVNAALTPAGEKVLLDMKHPREEAVRARFSDFDPRIKEVLGWASCQGYSFINRLVSSVDERLRRDLGVAGPMMTLADALRQAEDPLNFIEQASSTVSRFSDPAHYAVVTRDLADAPDDADQVARITLAEIEAWIDDGRIDDLAWTELAQFHDIAHRVLAPFQPNLPGTGTLELKVEIIHELLGARSRVGYSQLTGSALNALLTRFESLSTLPLLLRARWIAALNGRITDCRSDARGMVEHLRAVALGLAEESLANVVARGDARSVDALHLSANAGVYLTNALFNIWHPLPTETWDTTNAAEARDSLAQALRGETLPRLTAMLEQVQLLDSPSGRLATIVMLYAITHMAEIGSKQIEESQRSMAERIVSLPHAEISDERTLALLFDGPLTLSLFKWRHSSGLLEQCQAVAEWLRLALDCDDIDAVGAYHLTVLACATRISADQAAGPAARDLAERSYALSLALIRRGMAWTVIYWMSIQHRVYTAMGLGQSVPADYLERDYLERGWQSAQRTITEILDAGPTLTGHEIQALAGACLGAICRHVQYAEGPSAISQFMSRAETAIDSRVPHPLDLARYTWAMCAMSQDDSKQAIRFAWHASAYRAISGVSQRYLVLRDDRNRDDKIRQQLESAARSPSDRAIIHGAALDGLLDMLTVDVWNSAESLPHLSEHVRMNLIQVNADVDLALYKGAKTALALWNQELGQLIEESGSMVPERIPTFITAIRRLRATLPRSD